MIIVVEGISAAGKTTYASQFGGDHWIPEFETLESPPKYNADSEEIAGFWAEHNVRRFQAALAAEREHGSAICDTDPMKIHYTWCMERAGFDWPDRFEVARKFVRQAIVDRRLGFADRYYVKQIAPDVARAQKEGDVTRSRSKFEEHLALQPHLMKWFNALDAILPGSVEICRDFPAKDTLLRELERKTPEENPRRFDVSVFDALCEKLPL